MAEAKAGERTGFRDIVAIVVEENDLIRSLATHVLSDLGIVDVRRVGTEKDGLRAFAERPAHLVIVEFGREHAAARRLLERLSRSPQVRHGATGLIALVPEPDRDTVLLAHASGAEAVVGEPFSSAQLADHVRAIVRRHRAPAETHRMS